MKKSQKIVLTKNGKPVKMFTSWHKCGKWCDENITENFQEYYFDKYGYFKTLYFKMVLSIQLFNLSFK